jgi:uncharacterized RDD family membrane protein YckC
MSGVTLPSANPRWTRSLVTPEGVDLRLQIATMSQRASAFLIDAAIILVAMIVLTLLCLGTLTALRTKNDGQMMVLVWIIGTFFARNFYFILFEMGPRAATPGKQVMKMRVTTRDGSALTAGAVLTRNVMRELEVFLPLAFLNSRGEGVDALITLLGLVWTGVFVFFPLMNRDRLRLGDLVAGTWVVMTPRRALLKDLSAETAPQQASAFEFTLEQVEVYGVKELQMLEQVLRRRDLPTIRGVAERIRMKIDWRRGDNESDFDFLDAYYTALRRRLEQQILMGKRRADKHDR